MVDGNDVFWENRFTRFRSGHAPSKLDYVFTSEENLIDEVHSEVSLGKSDHVVLTWFIFVDHCEQYDEQNNEFNFCKGDYNSIMTALNKVNWQMEFTGKSAEEMWIFFSRTWYCKWLSYMCHIEVCIDENRLLHGCQLELQKMELRNKAWKYKATGHITIISIRKSEIKLHRWWERIVKSIRNHSLVTSRIILKGFMAIWGTCKQSRVLCATCELVTVLLDPDKEAADTLCTYFHKDFTSDDAQSMILNEPNQVELSVTFSTHMLFSRNCSSWRPTSPQDQMISTQRFWSFVLMQSLFHCQWSSRPAIVRVVFQVIGG